jgi:hypothetical protein
VADGEVGLPPVNTDTFLLVSNRSTFAASVRVTLLFDDGTAAQSRTFVIAPTSRFNVDVRAQFPAAIGKGFGALVESQGPTPAQIVVERSLYNDAAGVRWAAGANARAAKLQ